MKRSCKNSIPMKTMKQKIEILAPAGGQEALRAAVFSGADAVYLAGTSFGARAGAQNFTREQLREAAEFCAGRGVHLYVTVNTLLKETELARAVEFVQFLSALPVDAVIVQDPGLFYVLRRFAPQLPLHASTQMSVHDRAGSRYLQELGAARVVLARELSLEEIREIAEGTEIALEVFVHGALCMCLSGQCYFSAMLGSRSGNRGMCAQPCRLPFSAPSGTGNDLSLKDLMLAEEISALQEMGVASAKIEGRMKRPEYVAAAVDSYQSAARGKPLAHLQELSAVFSRSGFTKGYINGKLGREMFGVRTREDAATGPVLSKLKGLYRTERQRVPVDIYAAYGERTVTVSVSDREGHTVKETCPASAGAYLLKERCVLQLEKTGGTPFYPAKTICPAEGLPVQVSALNALRRQLLTSLLEQRTEKKGRSVDLSGAAQWLANIPQAQNKNLFLRAAFREGKQIPEEARQLEKIYLPLHVKTETLPDFIEAEQVIFELPRAIFGREAEILVKKQMACRMAQGFRDFACGNLGSVSLCREVGAKSHGLYGLNIANSAALHFFQNAGLADAELSFELAAEELEQIRGTLPRGLMLYGRQALMLTRNCPLKNRGSCKGCNGGGMLTDRMRKQFPVQCIKTGKTGYSEVFNSLPLSLAGEQARLGKMDFGILRFTVESSVECAGVIEDWIRQKKAVTDCTRGLFHRGVQ